MNTNIFKTPIGYTIISDLGVFSTKEDLSKYSVAEQQECTQPSIDISNDRIFLKFLLDKKGFTSTGGQQCLELFSKANTVIAKRVQTSNIEKFLCEPSNCNVMVVYGVRRTGKTYMMQQAVTTLLNSGINPKEVVYITIGKSGMDCDTLYDYICALQRHNVKYIIIDELTYAKGDVSFVNLLSDTFINTKFLFSGTDSLGFSELLRTALYNRASVIHTTYISYKEFKLLYPNATTIEYIESCGLLFNSYDYESQHSYPNLEGYSRLGLDYIGTAIADNLTNSLDKFDLSNRYPYLCNLYYTEKGKVRTLLFKWLQRYFQSLTMSIANSVLKLQDLGDLKDFIPKYDPNVSRAELNKLVYNEVLCLRNVIDFTGYTQEQLDDITRFLTDIDCLYQKDGSSYLLPIAVRFGCTCDLLLTLTDDVRQEVGLTLALPTIKAILLQAVEGNLLEDVIRINLLKDGIECYKLRRDDNAEIDLYIDGSFYEVKRTSNICLAQCRWLVDKRFSEQYKPKSLNVIYTGESTTVTCTRQDIENELAFTRNREPALIEDSTLYTINYINVDEFLLSIQPKRTLTRMSF